MYPINVSTKRLDQSRLCQIEAFARKPEVKIISLSAVGVLLNSPYSRLEDLYALLERKFRRKFRDPVFPFLAMRLSLDDPSVVREGTARSLREIYDTLHARNLLSLGEARWACRVEGELTINVLRARKTDILQRLSVVGKPIITFDQCALTGCELRAALNRELGSESDAIMRSYTSADFSSGSTEIFRSIATDFASSLDEIMHVVGEQSELLKQCKIIKNKFYFPSGPANFRGSKGPFTPWRRKNAFKKIEFPIRLYSNVASMDVFDQKNLEDEESTFLGDPYVLGHLALGPFILGLARWVIKNVVQRRHDVVAFCARDGHLLHLTYEILRSIYPDAPQSKYLRISRNVCLAFELKSAATITFNRSLLAISSEISVKDFLSRRFFLTLEEIAELNPTLEINGIDIHDKIGLGTQLFEILSSSAIVNFSLQRKRQQFSSFYLSELGDFSSIGLFDVGYNLRAQRILRSFLPADIFGYYISSFHETVYLEEEGLAHLNFLGAPVNNRLSDSVFPTALMELMLSEIGVGSMRDIRHGPDSAEPLFEDNQSSTNSTQIVKQIQKGALDFVKSAVDVFGKDIEYMVATPQSYFYNLDCFMRNPSKKDAKIFSDIQFGNSAVGNTFRIIGTDLKSSHWKSGYLAINKKRDLLGALYNLCKLRLIS
ncbi:hypothetical protein [Agrobacterium sp. DSM 25558]|uniref:hypothetical protein n=1 Tax=Agrobacterium sp. DSM 25558 TaxID=1907665 RepID=UPI001178BF57|nr:hypothetical protein [Agrobacterium sp. DSM 25558]